MASVCGNCGSAIGLFGATAIPEVTVRKYKKLISCPDELCTKCHGSYTDAFNAVIEGENKESLMPERAREKEELVSKIRVVSVHALPLGARYRLIDMVNFQSTLGTGLFSEFGSDISNIFGTEAGMLNSKMDASLKKCKNAMRAMAYELGANAVIGVNFDFSTNSKDATTVAAQGTAVFIENLDEVFLNTES